MNEFFKNPNVKYALIGGAVVAVIAFSKGAENVGSGVGAGAKDAGIGIGRAAVAGVSIWGIGEYILPLLLL
jgi:hypothetical protein